MISQARFESESTYCESNDGSQNPYFVSMVSVNIKSQDMQDDMSQDTPYLVRGNCYRDPFMSGFSVRLKSARQRLGITQEVLAEELNVTKASVSAWENDREKPGFRLLPKIKKVLGIPLDELICGEELDAKPAEPPSMVTRNETEVALLQAYRRLSAKRRKGLLDLLG